MNGHVDYTVELNAITSGFDGETCWVHARPGVIPGGGDDGMPAVVVTLQKLLLSGSDIFYGLHDFRTDDMGATWDGPESYPGLGRRQEPDEIESVICDFTPSWHAATGRLLGIGHVARYLGDHLAPDPRRRETAYSVYDDIRRMWSSWETVEMPDSERFFCSGAGCVQRVDLEDGTLLVPIYFRDPKSQDPSCSISTVMRCSFDGTLLKYLEHGAELSVPEPRGLGEPSLARFQDRYFLTLRNDVRGYVSDGPDGLNFGPPVPWRFDDGEELGNYNTQQHWVTHSDGLFLVYTRRGADNDHVFRHRAPLFMAQVDPEHLCVIRETERAIVPERGARLGNFGVANVTPYETWVVAAEWMQPVGCEKYGSDNTVWVARIHWETPNEMV
ncbi:MAG: exo-alpha-sialidase [Armatimonadetes bacterium]|nr:exo-alpha-sialidase [Armatimonadota bacterium]MDI9586931.1 exo-alpha-sialidase [Acidobacteriota bacterium]